jgi:hypothetical protein
MELTKHMTAKPGKTGEHLWASKSLTDILEEGSSSTFRVD